MIKQNKDGAYLVPRHVLDGWAGGSKSAPTSDAIVDELQKDIKYREDEDFRADPVYAQNKQSLDAMRNRLLDLYTERNSLQIADYPEIEWSLTGIVARMQEAWAPKGGQGGIGQILRPETVAKGLIRQWLTQTRYHGPTQTSEFV